MRAVVQRVLRAQVEVDHELVGAIQRGLLVYLGFARGDTSDDRAWMLSKIAGLRIFGDDHAASLAKTDDERESAKKMTRSVGEVEGAILLVSQFTLYGDVLRGRRPSFDEAMPIEEAREAFDVAVRELRALGAVVETGRFQAEMLVSSVNEGPVTLWIDSALRAPKLGRPPP